MLTELLALIMALALGELVVIVLLIEVVVLAALYARYFAHFRRHLDRVAHALPENAGILLVAVAPPPLSVLRVALGASSALHAPPLCARKCS